LELFPPLLSRVADTRDPKKIIYTVPALLFAGVLMFLCRLGSRRQVGLLLRTPRSIEKFNALFGISSFPHGDTLDYGFSKFAPSQAQDIVSTMTEILIRSKILYPYRLRDLYYVLVIDGTGTLSFPERHCPFCLTRTHKDVTTYYHNVLEAKLVTPNGFAFSLMSEFIENADNPNPSKQDCELTAFYRLAKRIKARFPRLKLCLSLDGLYAGGPTFRLCKKYGWRF
jgi:hypothetical protein